MNNRPKRQEARTYQDLGIGRRRTHARDAGGIAGVLIPQVQWFRKDAFQKSHDVFRHLIGR